MVVYCFEELQFEKGRNHAVFFQITILKKNKQPKSVNLNLVFGHLFMQRSWHPTVHHAIFSFIYNLIKTLELEYVLV